MSRATTKGGTTFGPTTFLTFLIGIGIGLGLVAPVLPESSGAAVATLVQAGGSVILVGVLSLAVFMVLLALLYQG